MQRWLYSTWGHDPRIQDEQIRRTKACKFGRSWIWDTCNHLIEDIHLATENKGGAVRPEDGSIAWWRSTPVAGQQGGSIRHRCHSMVTGWPGGSAPKCRHQIELSSNPSSTTSQLCDIGHLPSPSLIYDMGMSMKSTLKSLRENKIMTGTVIWETCCYHYVWGDSKSTYF